MQIKLDFSDPATWRGFVWILGSIVSFYLLVDRNLEEAMGALTLTSAIVGALAVSTAKKDLTNINEDS